MIVLKLLVSAYVLFLLVIAFLTYRTIPRNWRFGVFKAAAMIPFVAAGSFVATLFSRKTNPLPCYSETFGSTEERIESKRVEIFGGERLSPSISAHWRGLEATVRITAAKAKKMAGLDKPIPVHH